MIRNRLGLGLIGVDCRQRGVLCDGNLIARVDELAFHFPSAEVFGIFRRKYAGGAAAYILLVIRCYVFVLVLNVCDREAILCGGEERGNRNGAVKLGIYIEQRAVGINPSGGLFRELFKQCLKLFGIRKLCAVRNFNRFGSSVRRGRQVNLSFNNRRLPLCVERNALCRHRLAGEIIRRAIEILVIIPACKRKVCGYTGRSCRGCNIGNILLILAAFGFFRFAAVNERDVIGVTGVVEFSVVVIISAPIPTCTKRFELKARYRILIFVRNCGTRTGTCIQMMKHIFNSVNRNCITRTGESFHIIICSLTTITGLRSIESRTIQWHGINIDLIGTTAITCAPCAAAIVSRPLITDVRAIFCRNFKTCILLRRREPTTVTVELNVINISLIINVYDCGAVTGNGLLLNRLCGKAGIRFCFSFCLCAGRAFFGLCIAFHQRIAIIIRIFLPMDNGVFRFGIGFPVCGDRSCAGNRCNRLAICIKPTCKGVTAAGGSDRAQVKRFHPELRRHVVAAVGIERDPETGFNYRVNVCIAGYKCDGFGGVAALRGAPADNAFFFAHGELNLSGRGVQICFRNVFTGYACGGVINHLCTVFIHEVYVAVLLKLRRKFYGRTAGYGSNFAKTFKEIVAFIVPPNKACVFLCRCSRLEELIAFGDGLLPLGQLRVICIIETVGIDLGLLIVRTQHSHCNARFRALFRRCSFLCTCSGGRLCFHFNGSRGLYRGGSGCLLRSGSGCLLRSCGLLGRGRLVNDRRSPLHNIPCCSVGVCFLITHCKRARRTCRNQHTCAQQHGDDFLFHSVFLQSCDLSVL